MKVTETQLTSCYKVSPESVCSAAALLTTEWDVLPMNHAAVYKPGPCSLRSSLSCPAQQGARKACGFLPNSHSTQLSVGLTLESEVKFAGDAQCHRRVAGVCTSLEGRQHAHRVVSLGGITMGRDHADINPCIHNCMPSPACHPDFSCI